jgi:hypothetical protein
MPRHGARSHHHHHVGGRGGGGGLNIAAILALQKPNDDPYELFRLKTTGSDGQCGCPYCCQSATIYVELNESFVPNELEGLYDLNQYKEFANKINKAFHDNHWPILPCICAHFCLPFSPICAMFYMSDKRQRELKQVFTDENNRLSQQGLYWELLAIPSGMSLGIMASMFGFSALKFNQVARTKYESTNPQAKKLAPKQAADNQEPAPQDQPQQQTMGEGIIAEMNPNNNINNPIIASAPEGSGAS